MGDLQITVHCDRKVKRQGDLFGIFFEDINHAADGGLYGELVRNRSFEFNAVDRPDYHEMTAWNVVERGDSVTQAHVETRRSLNTENPHYLVLEVMTEGEGGGISNEGYGEGIPVEENKEYLFSCWYQLFGPNTGEMEIHLEDKEGGGILGKAVFLPEAGGWKHFSCKIKAWGTNYGARLTIVTCMPVRIGLDMVSLFPTHTFLDRRNGMRADIAELIRDMKPRFMRFPGGCLAHIGSLDMEDRVSMYRWKKTLGPVEKRPPRRNSWNYNQTLGLGFYEYFQFCEDIGAEPLPVISAGYDPHHLRMAPLSEMQEWVDEALDLIEFANGNPGTKWGAVRAEMGHPESFHLKYLAIGNEEVGDSFFERYEIILKAVKEKYPQIQVMNSASTGSAGSVFDKGWEQARRTRTSFVDEHFYQCPEWFLANVDRYADYAAAPKAFIGEYASKGDTWKNALMEAAFMTGLEKAEGVGLACYAPLLCHVDYKNWHPNLICYDNHRVFGTASYYVQKLFMNYQGETLLYTEEDVINASDTETPDKTAMDFSGKIQFVTERAQVDITDFCYTDCETGVTEKAENFSISREDKKHFCLSAFGSNYQITFKFCRRNGGLAKNLEGTSCFELEFAGKDEENKFTWIFDGWQRLTLINAFVNGHCADLGLYEFESEKNKVHEAKLIVEGNRIRTYIDGVTYCDHICKKPVPGRIYYSAVKESNGTVNVKAVNPETEERLVRITLTTEENVFSDKVKLVVMSGFLLEDRNSFENPMLVSPAEMLCEWDGKAFEYRLAGNSFAIMQFQVKG